jgi:hypothetical protein
MINVPDLDPMDMIREGKADLITYRPRLPDFPSCGINSGDT